MKNSNDSYRVTNCRSGELHTDQTIELEESIKNKLIGQKQLKRRMFELEQDIANIEYIVRKCQEEADTIKAFTEGNMKPRGINYYINFLGRLCSNGLQLKSKSWEPFWNYQLLILSIQPIWPIFTVSKTWPRILFFQLP